MLPSTPSAVPNSFSGYDTFNLGLTFTPLYAWDIGIDYFLYSAQQGPVGAPDASGFEKLFGGEFSLGIELDLSIKYTYSKYTEARFSYSRYTPPPSELFIGKGDPDTLYLLEVSGKF